MSTQRMYNKLYIVYNTTYLQDQLFTVTTMIITLQLWNNILQHFFAICKTDFGSRAFLRTHFNIFTVLLQIHLNIFSLVWCQT